MSKKFIISSLIGLFSSLLFVKPAFAVRCDEIYGGACYINTAACTGYTLVTEDCSIYDIPPTIINVCCVSTDCTDRGGECYELGSTTDICTTIVSQDMMECHSIGDLPEDYYCCLPNPTTPTPPPTPTPTVGDNVIEVDCLPNIAGFCACPCPESHPIQYSGCVGILTCGNCQCSYEEIPEGCHSGIPYEYCQTSAPEDIYCEEIGTCDDGTTRWCCDTSEEEGHNAWVPEECPCDPEEFSEEFCTENPALMTALGCVPTHPLYFIAYWRETFIALGGGIALLFMIVGALFVLTSQGNPEKVKRGKEIFIGGLTGLVVMIFTAFVLNFITVDILNLFIDR